MQPFGPPVIRGGGSQQLPRASHRSPAAVKSTANRPSTSRSKDLHSKSLCCRLLTNCRQATAFRQTSHASEQPPPHHQPSADEGPLAEQTRRLTDYHECSCADPNVYNRDKASGSAGTAPAQAGVGRVPLVGWGPLGLVDGVWGWPPVGLGLSGSTQGRGFGECGSKTPTWPGRLGATLRVSVRRTGSCPPCEAPRVRAAHRMRMPRRKCCGAGLPIPLLVDAPSSGAGVAAHGGAQPDAARSLRPRRKNTSGVRCPRTSAERQPASDCGRQSAARRRLAINCRPPP